VDLPKRMLFRTFKTLKENKPIPPMSNRANKMIEIIINLE